jgi:hypothetical protein
MIDMSDIASDPDFCQTYTVVRQSGVFALGRFTVTDTQSLPFYGSIQPATDEDLEKVPEGDRIKGAMKFISVQQMFNTNTTGIGTASALSDKITWRGQTYAVTDVSPWGDYGFWKAIGLRQSGA